MNFVEYQTEVSTRMRDLEVKLNDRKFLVQTAYEAMQSASELLGKIIQVTDGQYVPVEKIHLHIGEILYRITQLSTCACISIDEIADLSIGKPR